MNVDIMEHSQPLNGNAQQSFHIAFCVDNHYFRSMGATMLSIIENNPDQHLTFHVFAFSVSDTHRVRLEKINSRLNVAVQLHIIDPVLFEKFTHFIEFSYYSLSIFSRLIIPSILNETTDRVLYLDADILCVGPINALFEMDISDDIAIVVPDAERTRERRCKALALKNSSYFNGGVIFINIKKWIAADITGESMEVLLKLGKKLRFNDQDALNIVLDGHARYVDKKWNYIYDLIHDLDRNVVKMRSVHDAVFIHFAGAVKPWADWTGHASRDLFKRYHALSPWADMPLDPEPRNSKEMRMFSRFLLKRGELVGSARWFLRYLKARAR
jgi:lipopolysaccharide biosynthesis glycosyltransferase